MNEFELQLLVSLKFIVIGLYTYLYGIGGVRGKWNRRILGSVLLTLSIVGFSLWNLNFSWWYLLYAPLLWAATSVGYGSDITSEKLLKRSRYALACCAAALPLVIVSGSWAFFGLYTGLNLIMSTLLGTFNFAGSARAEESLIGATIGLSLFLI